MMKSGTMCGFGYVGLLITLAIMVAMIGVVQSSLFSESEKKPNGATLQERGVEAIMEAEEVRRLIEKKSVVQDGV